MDDVKRSPRNAAAAFQVHKHECPECGTTYTCNCSEQENEDKLVCIDCERKG